MLRKSLSIWSLGSISAIAALTLGLAASCDTHRSERFGGAADTTAAAPAEHKHAAASGSVEERLAATEDKLDKLISILEQNQALPPPEPDPALTYSVPVNANDPVEGPADAKITIVEAFEFACPYCWRANPTVEEVIKKHPKDVRVVSKYILIHGNTAVPAGLAACAASKQGKYSEMKALLWGKLFDATGRTQQDQFSADNMEKLATDVGLDLTKYKADFQSDQCIAWIKNSGQEMAAVGTHGTPSFYINGRHLGGALPLEEFEKVIAEEEAKADKTIAGGVKPADYYKVAVVDKGEKRVKGYFEN